MVGLRWHLLLLGLLLLLPVAAQARLTLGWVPGAAILGSEDQARRLAAYLEARLAEPVALRSCADEAQLQEWLHRYRMIDLAPLSLSYYSGVPAGQLLPVADLKAGSAAAKLVLRQGLRSDQQLQLRTLLAGLPEAAAGRDLLTTLGGLRLTPPEGAPRVTLAPAAPTPAPSRPAPAAVVWSDQRPAASPLPAQPAQPEAAPAAPAPARLAEPAPVAPPAAPIVPVPSGVAAPPAAPVVPDAAPVAPVEPAAAPPLPQAAPVAAAPPAPTKAAEATEPPAGPPKAAAKVAVKPPSPPLQAPPRLAALPAKPAAAPPAAVTPGLSEQTVARSLSSGSQPVADGRPLQTVYLVPFTIIMVPQPVAEAVFDRFVETLNELGPAAGYEFIILKEDLAGVDPVWLRKATYVTGEIFGYVEESGCCSTDIRSKSRLALYRPGSSEPKLRHEFPAKAFFDHDYSTLEAERKKLAERISLDLSSQLIKALGGG